MDFMSVVTFYICPNVNVPLVPVWRIFFFFYPFAEWPRFTSCQAEHIAADWTRNWASDKLGAYKQQVAEVTCDAAASINSCRFNANRAGGKCSDWRSSKSKHLEHPGWNNVEAHLHLTSCAVWTDNLWNLECLKRFLSCKSCFYRLPFAFTPSFQLPCLSLHCFNTEHLLLYSVSTSAVTK